MERSRWRSTRLVAVVAVLLLLAVGVVVVVLNNVAEPPISRDCRVELDDGTEASLAAEQASNAGLIAAVATSRELPARAVTIALATALQESKLRNLDYGDRDSLGLFQQRPSQGWGSEAEIMDPHYATEVFYDALVQIEGYREMAITEAAQRVQRSGHPEAYGRHEARARAFASALTGHSPAALRCRLPMPEEDGEPAASLAAARFAQDFGIEFEESDGELRIDAGELGDQEQRLAWAVAQWAVATASDTGVTSVWVDDLAWQRDAGNGATWQDQADESLEAGVVVVE